MISWQRLAQIYDSLSKRQRLLIGIAGIVLAITISWSIVVWVGVSVVQIFLQRCTYDWTEL